MLHLLQLHVGGHHHHGLRGGVLGEHHLEVGRAAPIRGEHAPAPTNHSSPGAQDDLVRLDGVRGVVLEVGQHQRAVGEALGQENLGRGSQYMLQSGEERRMFNSLIKFSAHLLYQNI